jgi:invasion protein IalB
MTQNIKSALITAAFMSFGAVASAQTTTEGTTDETTAEERTDGLSTGEVAVEEGVGKTFVESVHGDWELRCIKAPEGQKDPCQLYQLLKDQSGNSVAEINLFNLPDDDKLAAGATIVTPLETLLTRNVVLSVDGGAAKSYPFTFCTAIGCFSRVGFTAEDVSAFKRGNAAKIVVIPAQAPTNKVELTVSLTGFTAAFDAVTEATKP